MSRVEGPVLITGGAGSVGVRLTERFLEEGLSVRAFDLPMMDFSPPSCLPIASETATGRSP